MHYSPAELKQFWKSVEKLRLAARLKHSDIAELLMITDRHYKNRHESNQPPHAMGVLSLTRHFDIDPRKFVKGEVDWGSVIKRLRANSNALPDRYTVGAFSRRRTSIHILSYLERTKGDDYVYDLLRRFDLTEASFVDPDEYINIHFLTDLADRAAQLGADEKMLFNMGAESPRVNKNIGFSKNVLDALKIKDACIFQANHLMGYFDKNCFYRIGKATNNFCTIEARQNPDVLDVLKVKHHGSQNVCSVKAGVAGSFPEFFNLPTAHIRESKCIHRGDPFCVYEMDFSHAEYVQKTSPRFRSVELN